MIVNLVILLGCYLVLLSSCASNHIQIDYESSRAKDTANAYEAFIEKHPESEYREQVLGRLRELREIAVKKKKEREERIKKEKIELPVENRIRVKNVYSYLLGKTTIGELSDDGWNVQDPYLGKLGIVGILDSSKILGQESVCILMSYTYKFLGYNRKDHPILSDTFTRSKLSGLEYDFKKVLKDPNANMRDLITNLPPQIVRRMSPAEFSSWRNSGGKGKAIFDNMIILMFNDGVLNGRAILKEDPAANRELVWILHFFESLKQSAKFQEYINNASKSRSKSVSYIFLTSPVTEEMPETLMDLFLDIKDGK